MEHLLLEPLKFYKTVKDTHRQAVSDYFEELVATSKMDVAENRKTVREYNQVNEIVAGLKKRQRRWKTLRVFLVILAVCLVALGVLLFLAGIQDAPLNILFSLLCIGGVVGIILLCTKKINPLLRNLALQEQGFATEAKRLYELALSQMAPLNALFDDTDTHRLIEKVMPQVDFHRSVLPAQMELLRRENDYGTPFGVDETVLDATAGTLCKNPFVFVRYRHHHMGTKTYHGSIRISWTERVRGSDGKWKTVHRSQTLTASVTKPKPYYSTATQLRYGNQAAPDLTFSRDHEHVEDLSERALEKHIEKREDQMQERARKATARGGQFQEMANTEFEALFDARDRNNEVQFRVMYTPLAQQNTTALLLDDVEGWGDDFSFFKQKRCNTIVSEHAQSWDMDTSAVHYRSHDVDDARARFLRRNEAYFRSVFFDFAPLLSVPAYQDPPSITLDEVEPPTPNSSAYEYELLANALGWQYFAPQDASEGAILKARHLRRDGDVDHVDITAYSYRTVQRIDYIPRFGGDGRTHSVPVHWIEYIPLESSRLFAVRKLDLSEREFASSGITAPSAAVYRHGLLGYLL